MTATMLKHPSGLSCPPRFGTPRNPTRPTLGPHVASVAESLGKPLMPWQRYVADVALEVRPDGALAYNEVVLTVPRQSGKTTLLLPVFVHRSIAEFPGGNLDVGPQRQTVAYTAQTRNDARKKWIKEFIPLLEKSPFRRKFHKRLTNGSEGFDWANGSTFDLVATMEKSGHGDTLDLGIIDEAFAQVDDRLEQAMEPATATRRAPQIWVVSTAGESALKSPFLWSKVEAGRASIEAGAESTTAYFEWSVGEDEDTNDIEVVASRHPAVGFTITADTLLRAKRKAERQGKPDGFRRAYCNIWGSTETQGHLPIDDFDLCGGDLGVDAGSPVAFAVDVTPDRGRTSVLAVGFSGDRTVAELIADRAGTDWVGQFMLERQRIQAECGPSLGVAIDAGSAAASIADDLETLGVPVTRMSTRDMCSAAGRLFDAVRDHRFAWRNVDGQAAMRVAAVGAVKRDVGESWLFARRAAVVNVCPIIGSSIGMWLLETTEPEEVEPEPFVFVVKGGDS